MPDQTIVQKAKALNPFDRIANVLVPPTPAAPTTPLASPGTPAPLTLPTSPVTPATPTGPNVQVDWADPLTGKRMSGTTTERDAALKAPAKPKPITTPKSLSSGGRR